jgi:uncharacterized protein with NRDE domain
MCTLTYLPFDGGFTFTHNRDERSDRPASENIQHTSINDQIVYFPQDLEGSGSWIAYSPKGRAVCLLNGGSEPHQRQPSYRHSRGLVVLDNFKFPDQESFYKEYNLQDIEPFTLIVKDQHGLWKIVHNESDTLLHQLDENTTGIWSSTTLYTSEVRDKRERWFHSWLEQKPNLSPENIRHFHQSAGEGDSENDLIMSRWGILETVSITQIHAEPASASLLYQDLVRKSSDQVQLEL